MANLSGENRALITGRAGFTGGYVTRELESAGYRVFGTAETWAPASDDTTITVDLRDRERLRQAVEAIVPDVVVHLAAVSFVAHDDAETIYRTNLLGTRNLLEALSALTHPPRAVVLASSANVYGNAAMEVIDETVPPAPENDYAVSKLAMEYMAHLWQDRLPISIVRPFNYTGVGQPEQFLLPKIVAHYRERRPVIELGNLDVARDFSDVRVVANAYRRIAEHSLSGVTLNMCSGIGFTLSEILAMMAEIAGYEIEVRVNPEFVRDNEVKRLLGSRRRLEELIGPLNDIPLRSTLQWMYSDAGV